MSISFYGALADGFRVTPEIKRAAEKARSWGVLRIKARSPVKTGRLRDGWQANLEGYGLRIENPVPYTIYQEMGTRRFPGRHMLSSTYPEIVEEFRKQLSKEVGKKLSKKIIGNLAENPTSDTSYGTKDSQVYQALTSTTRTVSKSLGFKGSLR